MEVFRTEPLLVPKIWGGRNLATLFGKTLPDASPYGESWEVADLPEGQSTVATGTLAGAPLREAVQAWGRALTGAGGAQFPLLVKLLDAAADLSVQVHPGPDDAVVQRGEASAKDECWVILAAQQHGGIVHGLRRAVSAAQFREVAQSGELASLLRRVEVAPGDVFRVGPGTIHAIGAGVCLLEVQQPSDTTYRVWDYNRPGLDGLPRALHLDDALAVAALEPSVLTVPRYPSEREDVDVLANVDAYRIERLTASAPVSWAIRPDTPQVVHAVRGEVVLNDVTLGAGQTAIIPAEIGRVWLTPQRTPDDRERAVAELIVAGLGGNSLIA